MLYITALIVENVNLDQLAEDDDAVQRDIRMITEVRMPSCPSLTLSFVYLSTSSISTWTYPDTRYSKTHLVSPLVACFTHTLL
jgi:hypothetical protein